MAKKLSIKETEDLVFSNKIIHVKLNKYKYFFDTYTLGKAYPPLANASKRCLLDFISLATEEDVMIISEVLGYQIELPNLQVPVVKNYYVDVDLLEFFIQDASNYSEVLLYRKDRKIGVTLWR